MNRHVRLARTKPFPPGQPLLRTKPFPASQPPVNGTPLARSASGKGSGSSSGRPKSFPLAVAAILAERDSWCVYCGSPRDLQNHHRRLKGIGGDTRDHTQCACNGVRLCADHHAWAHSGSGRRDAEAEGLIVPRSTLEPFRASVLVHLEEDRGGMRLWPLCDGTWGDAEPLAVAS